MNLKPLFIAAALAATCSWARADTLFGVGPSDSAASIKVRRPSAEFEEITSGVPDHYFALKVTDKDIPGALYVMFNEAKAGWFKRDEYKSVVKWVRFMPNPPLKPADVLKQFRVAAVDCTTEEFFRLCSDATGKWYVKTNMNDNTVRVIDLYFDR